MNDNFINRFACGDSSNLLSQLDSDSIDLIVTSPPYNVGMDYDEYKDDMGISDYHKWLRKMCRKLFRVINPNANIFINIGDIGVSNRDAKGSHKIGERGNFYVVPRHIVVIEEMVRIGCQFLNPIFWSKPSNHKSQFGASARFCGTYPYPANCHVPSQVEYVLHFRKNGRYVKVDREKKEQSIISKERWFEISSQIWSFNGVHDKAHPATFPIELPTRCIEGWSFVGDTVLDPFMGIGTTAFACVNLNRQFIGFDMSQKYCSEAEQRIKEMKNGKR